MPIRTKMFLGWVALTLAIWGGAFWVIRRSVEENFHQLAAETFSGISRGLNQQCLDRVSSMQLACRLVANIPELRALIAEQNYEIDAANQDSLRERLDNVQQLVGATFVCALGTQLAAVAQNEDSPWESLDDLNAFLRDDSQARTLLERTWASAGSGQYGLWVYRDRLYQIASLPLVFQADSADVHSQAEGMLVIGKQLTGEFCRELGQSYGSQLSFLTDGRVLATSLPLDLARDLTERLNADASAPTAIVLGDTSYRLARDGLVDPCSGMRVGTIVVQRDEMASLAFLRQMSGNLLWTTVGGVVVAAVASFLLSSAITRPVRALSAAVSGVGAGRLDVSIQVTGRDEMSQLADAFNHMVEGLRHSRGELERMLDEARQSTRRAHLLGEITQQVNQRLDVHSSLTMFATSVRNLFPDVDLTVVRCGNHDGPARLLSLSPPQDGESESCPNSRSVLRWIDDPPTAQRLAEHEAVIVGLGRADGDDDASLPSTMCLVPMLVENRLLGVIAATRRPVGFSTDERTFLQSLADHFAIALANAQVHEELRKAYQDLRANQRQIIQTERLRALGQMASGIAHDFNNHLTIVLAFLEMALDSDDLDADLRNWIEMSREASLGAADVVKLLRSFYRREATESAESVDINKLVSTTISLTRPRWFDMPSQHGLSVHVREVLGEVGCVRGSAAELRDALTNLLFNAVDAMPHGGEIVVRTGRQGDEVLLSVADGGTGMTDDVREQCLDPFFTTKGTQGTGLGLSMVHGIVERHRGRLHIDSQLGRGTEVQIYLPGLAPAEVTAAPTDRGRPDGACRVLCVDDDQRILKSLAGVLGQMGHEVAVTESGHEALEWLASEEFDVLITDLGMPGLDGREVARRGKVISPSTRVIMLTGWADRLMVEGQCPAGVDQVLGKPITRAQLQEALGGAAPHVKLTISN